MLITSPSIPQVCLSQPRRLSTQAIHHTRHAVARRTPKTTHNQQLNPYILAIRYQQIPPAAHALDLRFTLPHHSHATPLPLAHTAQEAPSQVAIKQALSQSRLPLDTRPVYRPPGALIDLYA